METQDKLYEHNKENPGLPLLVRIGVHLGDIYFFENDALGEGINIAARLQSLARPGCICFSQDVYNLVLNKIEFRAEKLGKVSLKNITKEIHAYEITTPNVEFDPNKRQAAGRATSPAPISTRRRGARRRCRVLGRLHAARPHRRHGRRSAQAAQAVAPAAPAPRSPSCLRRGTAKAGSAANPLSRIAATPRKARAASSPRSGAPSFRTPRPWAGA